MGRGKQGGFTLIEVMMTVAIVGVLAGIAVVTFGKTKERAAIESEVNTVFAALKVAEQTYQTENLSFLETGTDESDIWPANPNGDKKSAANPPQAWQDIGAKLSTPTLYCGYVVITGKANDDSNIGNIATTLGWDTAPDEDWFYIIARCDQDGDGEQTVFLTASNNNKVAQMKVTP